MRLGPTWGWRSTLAYERCWRNAENWSLRLHLWIAAHNERQ